MNKAETERQLVEALSTSKRDFIAYLVVRSHNIAEGSHSDYDKLVTIATEILTQYEKDTFRKGQQDESFLLGRAYSLTQEISVENNTVLRCLHADPSTLNKEDLLNFMYTVYVKFKAINAGTEVYDTDNLLVPNLNCWGGVDTPYSTPHTAPICMGGTAYLLATGKLWWEVNAVAPTLPGMRFLDSLRGMYLCEEVTSWRILNNLGYRMPQLRWRRPSVTEDLLLKTLEEFFVLNCEYSPSVLPYK